MKRTDFIVIAIIILCLLPFFLFDGVYDAYCAANQRFPLCLAFLKFGILATFGEMLGNRVKTGKYNYEGFGVAPKFVVWGFIGMWIALGMSIFRLGMPAFLERYTVFNGISAAMMGPMSWMKLFGAFCISVSMNAFAPVFFTVHKIFDLHIAENGGKLSCLLKPVAVQRHLSELDWGAHWGFVIKKTIPRFWIPAHTLTFCLPQDLQVLFAAFCGVVLGLLLAIASMMGKK